METSWDRLVARIAIESTVDAILAQAELRQPATHTHTSPENPPLRFTDADVEVALLPLTYAATFAHMIDLSAYTADVAARVCNVPTQPAQPEHECPVQGCVQCDTLTFRKAV